MSTSSGKRNHLSALKEIGNLGNLNLDIVADVLSRLPTKFLPKLKCVCKEWNQLISSPTFMKAQYPKREPVSGFFFQQKYQWCNDDITTINYIPVGKEQPKLHQTVFNFLPEHVVILASCNGLVCCRSCYVSYDPQEDPCLYICNPLNNGWIRLNWDEPDKRNSFGLAFDPSRHPNFKLIRVKQFEADEEEVSFFSFEIFSSDAGVWKKSEEICECNNNLSKNKCIYVEGILHWLTDGDKVLTFNVESELSWLVSVPLPASEFSSIPASCIGNSEGKLHYILVSEYGLQVWFLEEYFESSWSLKLSKTLDDLEEEHSKFFCNLRERVTQRLPVNKEPWIDPLAFKDGYLLMRLASQILLYNIDTNEMHDVCCLSKLGTSCPTGMVLPYTMNLVPLNEA